jgi:hypothetical protein
MTHSRCRRKTGHRLALTEAPTAQLLAPDKLLDQHSVVAAVQHLWVAVQEGCCLLPGHAVLLQQALQDWLELCVGIHLQQQQSTNNRTKPAALV